MKIKIKNIYRHFLRICKHKYWVAYYCFKCGLYWQGLIHDLSKFSWVEFWESVKYYNESGSPIIKAKEAQGFSFAWQHHKGRNSHHYEYWTDNYDSGTTCIKIPYKYVVELICDYLGAARAYLGKSFTYKGEYDWWIKKINTTPPKMHDATIKFISCVLYELCFLEKYHPNLINHVFHKNSLETKYNLFNLNKDIL